MHSSLAQHFFQCSSSRLDKVDIEATNSLLFWWWWYDYTGVVTMELVVEPKKVPVSACDGKLGITVGLGTRLDSVSVSFQTVKYKVFFLTLVLTW